MCSSTYKYNTSWEKVARLFPIGTGLTVLDLGCGDGRVTGHLTKSHAVFGIDGDPDAVQHAQTVGIHAVVGDINETLPCEVSTFDVVLALDILEHTIHFNSLLQEVRRVLKDDGYFILSMPNHFDVRTRFEILVGRGIIRWSQRAFEHKAWEYSHVRFLTLAELRNMLHEHDFHIDREQFNFMAGGILPTRATPAFVRQWLVRTWPNAWSGKFVVRARPRTSDAYEQIIIDKTPEDF